VENLEADLRLAIERGDELATRLTESQHALEQATGRAHEDDVPISGPGTPERDARLETRLAALEAHLADARSQADELSTRLLEARRAADEAVARMQEEAEARMRADAERDRLLHGAGPPPPPES
jgi:rhamnose utilization protein RhaD (predicted bifunctional aldolase and dehydrogenase)